MSPWAVKRLEEFGGDLSRFRVVRIQPSVLRQVAITKTEPGDENNQDISSLVGKVDIRQLEHLSQNDPDAYSYSGGLCLANQGLLEFVEMFKAPIKMLHPLLTATQEGNFKGTEGFSAIPFNGVIVAHSNESEWHSFRNNKNNEAFLDRIYIVKVPYCLRVSEEVKIYQKLLTNSSLAGRALRAGHARDDGAVLGAHAAEGAGEFEHLFEDARLRRRDAEGRRSQGQDAAGVPRLRRHRRGHDRHVDALRLQDPVRGVQPRPDRDRRQSGAPDVRARAAARPRGPAGRDTPPLRRARQGLSRAALRGVHRQGDPDRLSRVVCRVRPEHLRPLRDVRRLLDPGRGLSRSRDRRELRPRRRSTAELEKIEKPAGIANPKDFRNEIVNFVLRARANNSGRNPTWSSYEKLREVIEKKMFSNTEDLLPVISFNAKASADEKQKHQNFVARMVAKGYTEKQVRLLAEWYLRVHKSS